MSRAKAAAGAMMLVFALAQPIVAAASGDKIFANGFDPLVTLSIKNDLSWCVVSVNGGDPVTDSTISGVFEIGRTIPLFADTADSNFFAWGFWTGTDVAGNDTNMSTAVTMSGDKNVEVCCPDIGVPTCPSF